MKYVTFEIDHGTDKQIVSVLFSEELTHAIMAKYVRHGMMREEYKDAEEIRVRSAGFVTMPVCLPVHGESESLKMKPAEDDHFHVCMGPIQFGNFKMFSAISRQGAIDLARSVLRSVSDFIEKAIP